MRCSSRDWCGGQPEDHPGFGRRRAPRATAGRRRSAPAVPGTVPTLAARVDVTALGRFGIGPFHPGAGGRLRRLRRDQGLAARTERVGATRLHERLADLEPLRGLEEVEKI